MPPDFTADHPADVPRRTWRKWWRQLPGYWRIAVWSAVVLAVLHILFGFRLWIGELEPSEVLALRQPGQFVDVRYRELGLPTRDFRVEQWLRRLLWRSRFEVIELTCGPGTSDIDLARICQDFPNLVTLKIRDGEFGPGGLKPLARLKKLKGLSLADSNVNDAMADELIAVPQLARLTLDGTFITDHVGDVLLQLPNLQFISVRYTEVSPEAVQSWISQRSASSKALLAHYEWDRGPILHGFRFRWSDGRQSYRILRHGVCSIEGKNPAGESQVVHAEVWWGSNIQFEFGDLLNRAAKRLQGECEATIRFGELESEPVRFALKNGVIDSQRLEFRMPATKAEVLAKTPLPYWMREE